HQPERRPSRRLDLDEVPRLLREVERLAGARPRVVAQHLVVEALADPLVPAGWKQNLRLLRAGREPARELVSGRVDPVERAVALQRPDRIVADGDRAALGRAAALNRARKANGRDDSPAQLVEALNGVVRPTGLEVEQVAQQPDGPEADRAVDRAGRYRGCAQPATGRHVAHDDQV